MRLVWLLFVFITAPAFASLFVVEIQAKDVKMRSEVAQIIHIDSVIEDRVYSVVSKEDLLRLENAQVEILSVDLVEQDMPVYSGLFTQVIDFPEYDKKFHTYEEMLSEFKKLEEDYPGVAELFSIGKSIDNQDIWAIKIGVAPSESTVEKPGIAFMGTHHAREHVSTEVPILFAHELLKNYTSDPEVKSLLETTDIYLIPMVNPDGAMHDISGQRYRWWRKNRRNNGNRSYGVDLNRNYGFGWGTGGSSSEPSSEVYMGTAPFSEPETQHIRDFFVTHKNITIALSFHTFSELIMYPYGGRESGVGGEDEVLFKKMASDMAAMNGYTPMQSSELYIASGDTCDWLYGELSVYCFTFELSPASMFEGGFYPGASIIDRVFEANKEPMFYLSNLAQNPREALSY